MYGEDFWMTMAGENFVALQRADAALPNGWKLVDMDGDYYKLVNATDGRCVDVNPADKRLFMTNCGNYSGQLWKLVYMEDLRAYKLKTQYTGEEMCLNVRADDVNLLEMAPCSASDAQSWQLMEEAQQ
jgi:hypothetical protein